MDSPHILVIDDDARLRALVKKYLGDQGYAITTAANVGEAEEILSVLSADALVLDVMMPGESGVSFAARLATTPDAPPVLLLTARGEAEDRIAGLEAGAADYLTKPFVPKELLLRLKNLLERRGSSARSKPVVETVRFGDYQFAPEQGLLTKSGAPIYLTSGECECLRLLAASLGTPITREAMAGAFGEVQNERSIDVQINRLRKKIEPTPGKPIYLQTIRHAGYVLYGERG